MEAPGAGWKTGTSGKFREQSPRCRYPFKRVLGIRFALILVIIGGMCLVLVLRRGIQPMYRMLLAQFGERNPTLER